MSPNIARIVSTALAPVIDIPGDGIARGEWRAQ
jgi:hypothetical protein